MVFEGIVLQTIVRQLESKRSIIYEVSERNAGNNGGMDRSDVSFTHIVGGHLIGSRMWMSSTC